MDVDNSYRSYIYLLEALVPIHVGGGEGTGIVDMPIQREALTHYPVINGTAWKGAVRREVTKSMNSKQSEDKSDFSDIMETAVLSFSDLKILCFPVKSSYNLFSYVTCPNIIKRFFHMLEIYHKDWGGDSEDRDALLGLSNRISKYNAAAALPTDLSCCILEGIKFNVIKSEKIKSVFLNLTQRLPQLSHILNRIIVISDDNFEQFVLQSTDKIVRNKLDGCTSVNLFSKEYLPEGSLLYGGITEFFDVKNGCLKGILNAIRSEMPEIISIGGDYSFGKGKFRVYGEDK